MTNILDLPEEILCDIVQLTSDSTSNCIQVCKQWHRHLIRLLYKSPEIAGTRAFTIFITTILDDHIEYGSFVRILDLSKVIGTLMTIRLPDLMKSCPNLREFYAPQAAFTPYMMQVLPSLQHLRILDLASCIERFEISRVINYCSGLTHLHTLLYPRCAVSTMYPIKAYPPGLKHFALRGGLKDEFLYRMASKDHPSMATIESLLVAYAPSITAPPLLALLSSLGSSLNALTISWPLMRLSHNSLDALLLVATNITFLSISIDYISPRFFENRHERLETLELKFSGVGKARILGTDDLIDALDEEDVLLPRLRALGVSERLGSLLFKDPESTRQLRELAQVRDISLYECADLESAEV